MQLPWLAAVVAAVAISIAELDAAVDVFGTAAASSVVADVVGARLAAAEYAGIAGLRVYFPSFLDRSLASLELVAALVLRH